MIYLTHRKKHRVRQNEDTEEYIPKEQDKASEKDLKEMEISNLTDKEFRVTLIKFLQNLREG